MTITVDSESCTRCGTCVEVCPMGLIDPADKKTFPRLRKEKEAMCLSCGQCEAFCPPGALTLGADRERPLKTLKEGAIPSAQLGLYLKSRRSIRCYLPKPVPMKTIQSILDFARFAASGGNGQPVEWLVVHDPKAVHAVGQLTVEWMRELAKTDHPMSSYVPRLIAAWEAGNDTICRSAPHLIFPHIPKDSPIAPTDAIIALTHVDIAAPAFGIGTCWAGFVAMASRTYEPLQEMLALPKGRVPAYAMMLGYPRYKAANIPGRKPLRVTWK